MGLYSILKQCMNVYLPVLTKAINHAITENIFPEQFKKLEVIPLHKKKDLFIELSAYYYIYRRFLRG